MAQITRNNHYVPRFYLKNWSDTPGKVWRYRLLVSHENVPLWDCPSLHYTGCQSDLYTYTDEDSETDEFETWFSMEVEQPANEVIAKAINDKLLLEKDYYILSKFVAAQFVRTPASLSKQLKFYKEKLPAIVETTLEDVVRNLEETLPQREPLPHIKLNDAQKLIPAKVTIEKNFNNEDGILKFETILGRGVWLCVIKHFIQNTSKILMNYHWQIIKAAHSIWCTSDDPVICLNYYGHDNYNFGGGWGEKGTEILLPLSPKHLLYTQVGETNIRNDLQENPCFTYLIQKLTFEHAFRNIYSDKPFDSIASCKRRIVNNELFKYEKKLWENWYAEQTAAESNLKINSK